MQYLTMYIRIHNFLCSLHTARPAYGKGMYVLNRYFILADVGLVTSMKESMY